MTTAAPNHKQVSTKMEYDKPAYKPAKEHLISILIGGVEIKSEYDDFIPVISQQQKEWATNLPLSIRDWQMECSTVLIGGGFAAAYPLQSSALPSYAFMETDPLTTTQPKHCTIYFKDCVPFAVQ